MFLSCYIPHFPACLNYLNYNNDNLKLYSKYNFFKNYMIENSDKNFEIIKARITLNLTSILKMSSHYKEVILIGSNNQGFGQD